MGGKRMGSDFEQGWNVYKVRVLAREWNLEGVYDVNGGILLCIWHTYLANCKAKNVNRDSLSCGRYRGFAYSLYN